MHARVKLADTLFILALDTLYASLCYVYVYVQVCICMYVCSKLTLYYTCVCVCVRVYTAPRLQDYIIEEASGGETNCSMPLVCDTHTHIYAHTHIHYTHAYVHTLTRARGRNVKCIRKLENTKTPGTNEQYHMYRDGGSGGAHCMRIDFRKIKKKTFSNEMSEKKNLGSDTQIAGKQT